MNLFEIYKTWCEGDFVCDVMHMLQKNLIER